jgi:hypothetical protein
VCINICASYAHIDCAHVLTLLRHPSMHIYIYHMGYGIYTYIFIHIYMYKHIPYIYQDKLAAASTVATWYYGAQSGCVQVSVRECV